MWTNTFLSFSTYCRARVSSCSSSSSKCLGLPATITLSDYVCYFVQNNSHSTVASPPSFGSSGKCLYPSTLLIHALSFLPTIKVFLLQFKLMLNLLASLMLLNSLLGILLYLLNLMLLKKMEPRTLPLCILTKRP